MEKQTIKLDIEEIIKYADLQCYGGNWWAKVHDSAISGSKKPICGSGKTEEAAIEDLRKKLSLIFGI